MNSPPTDAASGATLNGSSWLSNLLATGLSGYIAVETIRAQKRQPGSVTTADIPRVDGPPADEGLSKKTLWLAGGVLAAALALVFIIRRK